MKSVVGFAPANHCAKCLKGAWMSGVTPRMIINRPIELKPWNSSAAGYLSGVAEGYEWAMNLHLPFERAPGNVERMTLVGGERLTLVNGRRLEIPALPRGWAGLGSRFTTYRNFQFAASHFVRWSWEFQNPRCDDIAGKALEVVTRSSLSAAECRSPPLTMLYGDVLLVHFP